MSWCIPGQTFQTDTPPPPPPPPPNPLLWCAACCVSVRSDLCLHTSNQVRTATIAGDLVETWFQVMPLISIHPFLWQCAVCFCQKVTLASCCQFRPSMLQTNTSWWILNIRSSWLKVGWSPPPPFSPSSSPIQHLHTITCCGLDQSVLCLV